MNKRLMNSGTFEYKGNTLSSKTIVFFCHIQLFFEFYHMCILMLEVILNGTIGSSQNKNCTDRKQIQCYIIKYLNMYTLSCSKVTLEQQYFIIGGKALSKYR